MTFISAGVSALACTLGGYYGNQATVPRTQPTKQKLESSSQKVYRIGHKYAGSEAIPGAERKKC